MSDPQDWSGHDLRMGDYDGPTDRYDQAGSGGYDGPSDGYDPTNSYDGPSQYDGPTSEIPTLPTRGPRSS